MRSIVLTVVAALLTACAGTTGSPAGPAPGGSGTWSALPGSPLTARYGAHAVTLDETLFIIGGTGTDPCPPNASCVEPSEPPFKDGASYEPTSDTWREIATAPVPLGYGSSSVVNGKVYLLIGGFGSSHPSVRSAFLSYDPSQDEWEELQLPPGSERLILTTDGPQVVAFQQSQEDGFKPDYVYDPRAGAWSELPPDPLRKSFDRWMVWTGQGLVLIGIEHVPQPGSDGPAVYRAAILDAKGRWTRFSDSEIFGYNPMWSWTAGKVLNPSNERADGGETNNWGRIYHAGGTLDPATGEWDLLPDPPKDRGEFRSIYAAGDRYATAYSGWVYDALVGRWLHLTRPDAGPDGDTAAAWLDDHLYIWGGVRWQGSEGTILREGWVWTPAAGEARGAGAAKQSRAKPGALDGLAITLELDTTSVQAGEEVGSTLTVRNDSGEAVIDPMCLIAAARYALVPVDDPGAELWLQPVVDCAGSHKMRDGFVERYRDRTFPARTKYGDALPAGEYIAVLEIEGYSQRLQVPVEITP